MGHCVDMYSFIKGDTDETVEFAENLHMHYLHSKSFGFQICLRICGLSVTAAEECIQRNSGYGGKRDPGKLRFKYYTEKPE